MRTGIIAIVAAVGVCAVAGYLIGLGVRSWRVRLAEPVGVSVPARECDHADCGAVCGWM